MGRLTLVHQKAGLFGAANFGRQFGSALFILGRLVVVHQMHTF